MGLMFARRRMDKEKKAANKTAKKAAVVQKEAVQAQAEEKPEAEPMVYDNTEERAKRVERAHKKAAQAARN